MRMRDKLKLWLYTPEGRKWVQDTAHTAIAVAVMVVMTAAVAWIMMSNVHTISDICKKCPCQVGSPRK